LNFYPELFSSKCERRTVVGADRMYVVVYYQTIEVKTKIINFNCLRFVLTDN